MVLSGTLKIEKVGKPNNIKMFEAIKPFELADKLNNS